MRFPLILLHSGLLVIFAISLGLRSSLFVAVLTLPVIAVLVALSIRGICLEPRFRKRRIATLIPGIALLAVLGLTNTPLKVSFAWFEPEFEELGQQLARGGQPEFPRWIGPFRLKEGGVRERGARAIPYLMTSGSHYEINGFVRDPAGKSFNLWSILPLDHHWAYIEED